MREDLRHFCDLAHRGGHPAASGGEQRAHALATAVLENLPGLDDLAIHGLVEFILVAYSDLNMAREYLAR